MRNGLDNAVFRPSDALKFAARLPLAFFDAGAGGSLPVAEFLLLLGCKNELILASNRYT